jgi:3-oxoacyl-[acyl-carrier protein] reductase
VQVAIITGGSCGIGRATSIALAHRGFAVVVNYAGSAADAAAVVSEIEAFGGKAVAIKADVASAEEVKALFDSKEGRFDGVDVVITCAGVMTPSPLAKAADEDFDRHFNINVRGTFNAFREAANRVRDNGRPFGFSSTTSALNAPGYSIYNATKGAIESMVRVVAKELGGRGITVNAVAPGPVETELCGKPPEVVERMASMAPLHRLGRKWWFSSHPGKPDGSTARFYARTAALSKGNEIMEKQIILVTGAGSGIENVIATVLARAGHCVYASLRLGRPEGEQHATTIRDLATRNAGPPRGRPGCAVGGKLSRNQPGAGRAGPDRRAG